SSLRRSRRTPPSATPRPRRCWPTSAASARVCPWPPARPPPATGCGSSCGATGWASASARARREHGASTWPRPPSPPSSSIPPPRCTRSSTGAGRWSTGRRRLVPPEQRAGDVLERLLLVLQLLLGRGRARRLPAGGGLSVGGTAVGGVAVRGGCGRGLLRSSPLSPLLR